MSRTTTVFGIQTAAVEAQASTYLHQRGVRLGLEFVRGVNALIKQVRARAAPVLVVCVRERVSYPWLIRHSRGIQPDEQARHVCPVVQQELLSGSPAQIPCSTVGLVHYVAWDFGVNNYQHIRPPDISIGFPLPIESKRGRAQPVPSIGDIVDQLAPASGERACEHQSTS